ncbi:MAG: formate--tetrahydrofolate ligase [Candidatus Gracilibacteria bacterium]|nr:formate--tetrahydrofolate ligase [Candidatus Gracilibacteria bacterium]
MLSDIEISQKCDMKHISEIAKKIGISSDELEFYGDYKAKIKDTLLEKIKNNKYGKLILVTAVSPTPMGEGKTTTTIGLGDAMCKIGKKSMIALREPSLGPVMGMKGGATGGGYSQVVPMEDINLHFTGDFHAITSAHLLLSACIDNHIYYGNELNIDKDNIIWKRAIDVNDRALRSFDYSFDGKQEHINHNSGFTITTASEIMAIFCLASDIFDLKYRLGEIIFAYDKSGKALKVSYLKIQGAMTALLKDAIKPNIVQTLEANPCIIHGGPFANIAHGCNSIIATKTAMKMADYTVTEAGFGSDLGAEKFMDIKCRIGEIKPDLIILVATIKSIKYNSGIRIPPEAHINPELNEQENLEALEIGFCNLEKHIENMKKYGLPIVVCLNRFNTDTEKEIEFVKNKCEKLGAEFELGEGFMKGGEGMVSLAKKVVKLLDETSENNFKYLYETNIDIKSKIEKIVTEIYGGAGVKYSEESEKQIEKLSSLGYDNTPVCIAKTPLSFSDNPELLGSPRGFTLEVKEVKISSGAGFIVVIAGNIMTMPGLSKIPNATKIDIDSRGKIFGLS